MSRQFYTTSLLVDLDWAGFAEKYCYPDPGLAVFAFATWTGEDDPIDGWIRHIRSGGLITIRRNLATGEEWEAW